jgi:hypothetical protein
LDYNNYYTGGTVLGVFNGTTVGDINTWKTLSGQDANSVSVFPPFYDLPQSLDIDGFDGITCPVLPAVPTDINGETRQYSVTSMGAYQLQPYPTEKVKHLLYNFPSEAITNQVVPIEVEVSNYSAIAVDSILFEYAVNGGTPIAYSWTPSSPLGTFSKDTANLGSITALADATIEVWIVSVNNLSNALNDTAVGHFEVKPLAEFAPPFVKDTISQLSFNVNVTIRQSTGAPVVAPKMYIHTIVNGSSHLYDSVMLVQSVPNATLWTATVPPKYYGSKVIYSLQVSDTLTPANSVTLTDSTYIIFKMSQQQSDYIYFGAYDSLAGMGNTAIVLMDGAVNSWSRHLYLNSTLTNFNSALPVELNSIAFRITTPSLTHRTQIRVYMKATNLLAQTTTAYLNPISDGATLVYQGPMTLVSPGWINLSFTGNPFLLPAGSNLMVYVEDDTPTSGTYTWRGENSVIGIANRTYYGPSWVSGMSSATGARSPVLRLGIDGVSLYPGNNLAILNVVAPVNSTANSCSFNTASLKIALTNLGTNNYNFAIDTIGIGYEITDPRQAKSTGHISIRTGGLQSGKTDTLTLKQPLPLPYSGTYIIKAWVKSPIDNVIYDDTIVHTYLAGQIELPIDADFSNAALPVEFVSEALAGPTTWEPYQPSITYPVQPDYGFGMLRYEGENGTVSELTTRPIDINGAVGAKLEFWYYHDSTPASPQDRTYMDVYVIADGARTLEHHILKRGTPHGWKYYFVDLSPYTTAQCVMIKFESGNNDLSGAPSVQYIDRIYISAQANLALDTILISSLAACDFINKQVQVVIHNTSVQRIDFSTNPTQINLEIRKGINAQNHPYLLNTNYIGGNMYDTITVATLNLDTGIYSLTAYLTTPVDIFPKDDTTRRTLAILPDIAITATPVTSTGNCIAFNEEVEQWVTVTNKGNMDIYDIPLVLEVWLPSGLNQTLHDTLRGVLQAGAFRNMPFEKTYTVPKEKSYRVVVYATLSCDVSILDNMDYVDECVDFDDIALNTILSPYWEKDMVGITYDFEIEIENKSPDKTYPEVKVNVLIQDGVNQDILLTESITNFEPEEVKKHKFATTYTVPNVPQYMLTFFVNSVDNNSRNDTLKMPRITVQGIIDGKNTGLHLGQNIPNPANDNTRIEYSVPGDGEVIFTVYTITGQSLHSEKKESYSGINSIEFNTARLANGIYYYSMEYKGERLVKKMSIQK